MGRTSIEWTDYSWPVVNGCRRISPGCTNCYAERLTATRLSKTPKYEGLARFGKNGPRWTGEARLWMPHLDMPLKLKKPSRIFVADMGDLFYEEVSNDVIAAVFGVMAACPQHTFQVLTKRPARARDWFAWASDLLKRTGTDPLNLVYRPDGLAEPDRATPWPLPNVWLGVSVEDQERADERIPELLAIPAAVRFVSAEPLLGPVDVSRWLGYSETWDRAIGPCKHGRDPWTRCDDDACTPPQVEGITWIIVGGESGPGARPFDVAWARSLVQQCASAGVACFVKQLGAVPVSTKSEGRINHLADYNGHRTFMWQSGLVRRLAMLLNDRKGGDPAEWPEDIRVRQFPTPRASVRPEKEEVPPAAGRETPGIPGR